MIRRSQPAATIVIPAHNEEAVIQACLEALLTDRRVAELEVIVVCNGCDDRTAAVAASFGQGVRVLETPVASKTEALNLGDEFATAYPRIYLDADVLLPAGAIHELIAALEQPGALIAAPELRLDVEGASWPVRAHTRAWLRLPYVTSDQVGTGVLALSAAGRRRFGRFPPITADDLFVRNLFLPAERRVVPGAVATVQPPRTLRSFVRAKSRVVAGNLAYWRSDLPRVPQPRRNPARTLRALVGHPAIWPDATVYIAINLAIRALARRRLRGEGPGSWEQDRTTRESHPPANIGGKFGA